jgi:hypothetical protein
MNRLLLLSLLIALPVMAAKIAVPPLKTTVGVDDATKRALVGSLAAELNKRGHAVITDDQIAAMLNQEAKRQLAGCTDNSCAAQLGEALGVDEIALMTLSKIGQSWLINVQRIDVKQARTGAYERRVQVSSMDAVLDVLPALMTEAYGAASKPLPLAVSTPAVAVAPVTPTTPAAETDVLSLLPRADVPALVEQPKAMQPEVLARLVLVKNEAGAMFAYDPKGGYNGPMFVVEQHDKQWWFYEQRLSGGGSDPDSFQATFWDPRHDQRGLFVAKSKVILTCGKQDWPLQPLTAKARGTVMKQARFFQPKWPRRIGFVMRDGELNYAVIDQLRDDDQNPAFRLFVGKKGAMTMVPLQDAVLDQAGFTALGAGFKLQVNAGGASLQVKGQAPHTFMSVEVADSAAMVYGQLGLYPSQLGTLCDPIALVR